MLYEVITVNSPQDYGISLIGPTRKNPSWQAAGAVSLTLALPQFRITSYNVCYTKLLRKPPFLSWCDSRVSPHCDKRICVYRSYELH